LSLGRFKVYDFYLVSIKNIIKYLSKRLISIILKSYV